MSDNQVDKLESEVVALRTAVYLASELLHHPNMRFPGKVVFVAKDAMEYIAMALTMTQETAEAHDVKIKQEVREATIKECIEAIHETNANGQPQGGDIESGMLIAFGEAREALQALLQQTNTNKEKSND